MSRLRQQLIRHKTQLGFWIMRPPLDRARTHLSLAPPVQNAARDDEDDVA